MPCDPLTFTLTPDQFAALEAKAVDAGLPISGPSGSGTHSGVMVSWNYDAPSQKLTIQCLRKPFIVGCDYVNNKITEMIQGVAGS